MSQTPVRTRIAPSPTGEPHVGLAYTAMVNMALIHQGGGGQFILRIEDTDQTRSNAASEQSIYDCMRWLGITFDESPEVGGPHGPYRQTERREIYAKYAAELEEKGHAFTCFCTPERLDTMRLLQKKQGKKPMYDGHCLNLSKEDVAKRKAAGEPHVLRMKMPTEGDCTFTDGIYGQISIPWADVDMQVIMKADGLPTYHLAVVVDDHLMGITHIVRGEEWIPSTPKHIKLYEYFGWEMPPTYHLPVLRNPDRTKLSKRKNHTSLRWFQGQGYLPQAIINFLGQSFVRFAEGEEEVMPFTDFLTKFDAAVVSKAGAVFDLGKLDWFNGRWLREKLSDEEYLAHVTAWANEGDKLKQALLLARSRIVKLAELPTWVGPVFQDDFHLTAESFAGLKSTPEQTAAILAAVLERVEKMPDFTPSAIWDELKALEGPLGLKARVITAPLFIAIGGKAQGLPLTDSMALIGKSLTRARLKAALALFQQTTAEDVQPAEEPC
ncbi:MAG: glutamate--tRNA ligase [Pseudomonadaceae bacterium]|nr:glutamate--tRNA ligase [Pseudomonadaceae bacterium]